VRGFTAGRQTPGLSNFQVFEQEKHGDAACFPESV
jgi:hypothetical protein